MATIKGFEVSGTIYDNEDETARSGVQNVETSVADLVSQKIYSTDETDTGQKWIDGKPIYRKVSVALTQTTIQAGSWTTMLTMSDLDSIVDFRITDSGSTPFFFTNLIVRKNGSNIQVIPTGQGWSAAASNTTRYVIIEYTKTTN